MTQVFMSTIQSIVVKDGTYNNVISRGCNAREAAVWTLIRLYLATDVQLRDLKKVKPMIVANIFFHVLPLRKNDIPNDKMKLTASEKWYRESIQIRLCVWWRWVGFWGVPYHKLQWRKSNSCILISYTNLESPIHLTHKQSLLVRLEPKI